MQVEVKTVYRQGELSGVVCVCIMVEWLLPPHLPCLCSTSVKSTHLYVCQIQRTSLTSELYIQDCACTCV